MKSPMTSSWCDKPEVAVANFNYINGEIKGKVNSESISEFSVSLPSLTNGNIKRIKLQFHLFNIDMQTGFLLRWMGSWEQSA
jgi:hypothetical protein